MFVSLVVNLLRNSIFAYFIKKSVQCIHCQSSTKTPMEKCHLQLICSATCDPFKIDTPPLVFFAIFASEKPLC